MAAKRGVLLSDMDTSLGGRQWQLLEQPRDGASPSVLVLSTKTTLDFRDGAQIRGVLAAERSEARTVRATDVRLGERVVQLGRAKSIDVNRLIGAHVVNVAAAATEGGERARGSSQQQQQQQQQQTVLILIQHESAVAPTSASLTFHAVFRALNGAGGGGGGGAGKDDDDDSQEEAKQPTMEIPTDWLTWVQELQVRGTWASSRSNECRDGSLSATTCLVPFHRTPYF